MVKNLPAVQETWVQYLGWEEALEKGMATHSSILAWEISWTEEPGKLYSSQGCKRGGCDLATKQQQSLGKQHLSPEILELLLNDT